MKSWSIADADAKISEVFEAALAAGPQKIERRGSGSVVIVAEADGNRLFSEYQTFSDLVLNASMEQDDLPKRRPARVIGSEMAARKSASARSKSY
jgi:hypothetical protein